MEILLEDELERPVESVAVTVQVNESAGIRLVVVRSRVSVFPRVTPDDDQL